MALNPYASIGFLSGSGLSTVGTEGMRWVNVGAVVPGSGLWNPNPPGSGTSNPNPPAGTGFVDPFGLSSNPNPPGGTYSNPNPPTSTNSSNPNPPDARSRPWPLPTLAPPPRLGIDPDWVFSSPATLLAQALRRSAARIERPPRGKVTPAQLAQAAVRGQKVQGSNLWRWAPEFRAKTVAAELLGRTQVVGLTVYLLGRADAAAVAPPQAVYALPPSAKAAGANMGDQVDKVVRAAVEREDRMAEILTQMDDFWPFFESITGVALDRAPRTAQLLAAAHDWLLHLIMRLKHDVAALRPVQTSSLVVPLIPTPGHGSLPSGHATQAAFTSELLHLLLYQGSSQAHDIERSAQLDRLARRIAFNRVVAGVHFPVDSQAGYKLGTQMARLVSALAGNGAHRPAPLGPNGVLSAPFDLPELDPARSGRPPLDTKNRLQVAGAPLLKELWEQVRLELEQARI